MARTGATQGTTKPVADMLAPGDRAPNFLLPTRSDAVVSFYDKVRGGPIVVLLYPDNRDSGGGAELRRLFELAPEITAAGGHVFTIGRESVAALQHLPGRRGDDLWSMADADGRVAAEWGTYGALAGFVCDANTRVVATLRPGRVPIADRALDEVRRRPRPAAAPMPAHPPILVIPDVIDRDFCRYLIDRFERGDNQEGGTFRMVDGNMVHAPNHEMKRRRDLPATGRLAADIADVVGRRVLTEVRRAFHSDPRFVEEFKIVRYSADPGGYFRAHRDNSTPGTAHRRFAMTLNLNAEAYEGGELRFPEYGNASYKPATGEAVVFSCNLLHEATDVTSGHRYVLLSFFYDEAGRQILARYQQQATQRQPGAARG
jgi:predicted 2-oxoglutarate/Fe(II)-dependent dioxygenase YbiX/peroxiredoxin